MTDLDTLLTECGIAAIDLRWDITEAVGKKWKPAVASGEVLPVKRVSSPGALPAAVDEPEQHLIKIKSKDKKYLKGRHPGHEELAPAPERRAISDMQDRMRARGASLRGPKAASSVAASVPLDQRYSHEAKPVTSDDKRGATGSVVLSYLTRGNADDAVHHYAKANGIPYARAKVYHDAGAAGQDFNKFHAQLQSIGKHLESPHAEGVFNAGRVTAHARKITDDLNTKGAFHAARVDDEGEPHSLYAGHALKNSAYMAGWKHEAQKHFDAPHWKQQAEEHYADLSSMGHSLKKGEFEHPAVNVAHAEGRRDAAHYAAHQEWREKHKTVLTNFGASPRAAEKILAHAESKARPTKTRSLDVDLSHKKVDDYTHPESPYVAELHPEHFTSVLKRLRVEAGNRGEWSMHYPTKSGVRGTHKGAQWHPGETVEQRDEREHHDGQLKDIDTTRLGSVELHFTHALGKHVFKLKPNMEWGMSSYAKAHGEDASRTGYEVHKDKDTGEVKGIRINKVSRTGEVQQRGDMAKTWGPAEHRILPKVNQLWRVKTADAWHKREITKDVYAGAGAAKIDKETGARLFQHKSGKGTTEHVADAMHGPSLKQHDDVYTEQEIKKQFPTAKKFSPAMYHSIALRPAAHRPKMFSPATPDVYKRLDAARAEAKASGTTPPKAGPRFHVHDVIDVPLEAKKDLSVKRVADKKTPVTRLPRRAPGESDQFIPRKED
jgi:hypothetical protein